MTRHYRHYVGLRLSEEEMEALRTLLATAGETQSTLIRFLVRTAGQRPDVVAAAIRREKSPRYEQT